MEYTTNSDLILLCDDDKFTLNKLDLMDVSLDFFEMVLSNREFTVDFCSKSQLQELLDVIYSKGKMEYKTFIFLDNKLHFSSEFQDKVMGKNKVSQRVDNDDSVMFA